MQHKLLYYPSPSAPPERLIAGKELRLWPSPVDFRAYIRKSGDDIYKRTIIIFHGNGGEAHDRDFYIRALEPFGYRVILAEYPMYGGRIGELGEDSFVSDAKETVRLAFEKYGAPLFLLGESLGSAVAAAVLKDSSVPINGVILITPWDTLYAVASSKFPFLPVTLFLKDKYDSIENLKSFHGRIAVVGAEGDEIIPVNHAHKLFQSLSGDKRMWIINSANHNNWPLYVNQGWWNEILGFIGKAVG